MPDGVVFGVWAKDFGHSFRQVATGFYRDESGVLVSSARDSAGQQTRLDEMALEPGPYPRGATWEVALASADRTLTAFAKVIPRPIAAQDGRCTVSLELASRRGDRFVASGAGFAPDEEVTAESRYSGRVIQKKLRVSADGRLLPELISHAASETDHTARYLLKGRSCEVTVDYEWGEPALMPR
jgi:hypothetical protein